MRKITIVAIFAGTLAAAGCTAVQKAAPTASPALQGPTPEQIAARVVKPGFVGQQQIGAWTIVCEKVSDKSAVPPTANGEAIQSQVIEKDGKQLLDVKIRVPPRPCLVRDVLEKADQQDHEKIATFRFRGSSSVLTLVLRGPAEIFPLSPLLPKPGVTDNKSANNGKSPAAPATNYSPDELAHLDIDGKTLTSPTMVCGPNFCIAGIEIPKEDEPGLLAARDIVLQLPPVSGNPPFKVNIPTAGLADAIGAMLRMDE